MSCDQHILLKQDLEYTSQAWAKAFIPSSISSLKQKKEKSQLIYNHKGAVETKETSTSTSLDHLQNQALAVIFVLRIPTIYYISVITIRTIP